ncbi:MAG: aldo/keto reductase [Candidatus Thorarchaeota archaeon]|jgi:predicted aldo/keto reductase-like oxidoreductase
MRLGKTGLEVSRVGIGGIPILRLPEKQAIDVIKYALDLGVTFLDTANAYTSSKTSSEELIGKGVAGRRDKVVIATKAGGRTKKDALKDIQTSLKRLDTDYIDIWQFHSVNKDDYPRIMSSGGGMEGAKEALDSGTIRHIGFSSHSIDTSLKMVKSGDFETVQFPINFVNNEAVEKLVPLTKKMDMGFIGMKPFAGGNLRHADLAIKYLLQFENVLPDPGVKSFQEIKEIVDIVDGPWDLSSSDEKRMQDIREELGTRFCRWCAYCEPCPNEVSISWLMNVRLVHSYGDRYFNNAAQAVGTAGNCVRCGECETKCPYELPIMETITANAEWFKNLDPYTLHSSGSIV